MGSFFKNLLRANNNPKNTENESKKTTKWFSVFKKTSEIHEQNITITGQEDNQGRIKNSNSASSLGSLNLSDKSFSNDKILLLPKMRRTNFNVPKFIPPDEWIKSQLFEVNHLISSFVDLISTRNAPLYKYLDAEVDQIFQILDDSEPDFRKIFVQSFRVLSILYKEEVNLWLELKFEAHLDSLLAQLAELCSQLPENIMAEIEESINCQEFDLDLLSYRTALAKLESETLSKNGSNVNESEGV